MIEEMGKSGAHVNVETKTALLKGYAHAGQLHKAMSLFEAMCGAKGKAKLECRCARKAIHCLFGELTMQTLR